MALSDLSDPTAVLRAVQEFNLLGRKAFLARYGFGEARHYFLELDGKTYDSKAILGAAHGYQNPNKGPLRAADFSGGELTVKAKLERLGFTVVTSNRLQPQYSSNHLEIGSVYTREQLRQLFGVTDATLNTGLFQPRGFSSLWIFLTEHKTSDRTQYENRLDGDMLYFQGQTVGRKDDLIIDHAVRLLELLVFYRKDKYEFSGAGFRCEGPFRYLSHTGSGPRSFVLRRIQDEVTEQQIEAELAGSFDPNDIQDARKRVSRTIALRRGQQAFRSALLTAYDGRCAITDCDCPDALEAAHIYPYLGDQTNATCNGLLLRADLHTLFDLGLFSIHPDSLTVVMAKGLLSSSYSDLQGKPIRMPGDALARPSKQALEWHWQWSGL